MVLGFGFCMLLTLIFFVLNRCHPDGPRLVFFFLLVNTPWMAFGPSVFIGLPSHDDLHSTTVDSKILFFLFSSFFCVVFPRIYQFQILFSLVFLPNSFFISFPSNSSPLDSSSISPSHDDDHCPALLSADALRGRA